MSKRGRKQNKQRRANQNGTPSERARLLAIFREQQREGEVRGESDPFRVWLASIRGAASGGSSAIIKLGKYGTFAAEDVLAALDAFEPAPAEVQEGAQMLVSTLEVDDRMAIVVNLLESSVGHAVSVKDDGRAWLRTFVEQFEEYDLQQFARLVSVMGVQNRNNPIPLGMTLSSLPPVEAADVVKEIAGDLDRTADL